MENTNELMDMFYGSPKEKITAENKKLYADHKELIEQDNWKWYGGPVSFKCVECGGYCSSMTFAFFKNDPTKVLCWNCGHKKHV